MCSSRHEPTNRPGVGICRNPSSAQKFAWIFGLTRYSLYRSLTTARVEPIRRQANHASCCVTPWRSARPIVPVLPLTGGFSNEESHYNRRGRRLYARWSRDNRVGAELRRGRPDVRGYRYRVWRSRGQEDRDLTVARRLVAWRITARRIPRPRPRTSTGAAPVEERSDKQLLCGLCQHPWLDAWRACDGAWLSTSAREALAARVHHASICTPVRPPISSGALYGNTIPRATGSRELGSCQLHRSGGTRRWVSGGGGVHLGRYSG